MSILGIIPARYASTRFPGKPLVEINGRSMICRVYDQAKRSGVLQDVIVATDNDMIFDHVISAGQQAVMTSALHRSGTDRCLEALESWEKYRNVHFNHIINIQGDEPFIHPDQIRKIAAVLNAGNASIATLAKSIEKTDEIFDPNVVKVVFDHNKNALYFSRAPVPYLRGVDESRWIDKQAHFKHIGIYGFQAKALKTACGLADGILERNESLEQLRWLEHGLQIMIEITDIESVSIDTPEDLLKITNTP
jgi:3-deoxy-manno-octulosonate cytidylyltransferase (CMP-KDO synthetase)